MNLNIYIYNYGTEIVNKALITFGINLIQYTIIIIIFCYK